MTFREIKYKKFLLVALLCSIVNTMNAQQDRKISFVGGARSLMNMNALSVKDSTADTTTVKNKNGGYALMDLGFNIRPNKQTEIMGMFRIRNEYGGFWGSGVTFDVRQLWIKGVVANALRYQLGDLNLKQTPFTLYNHHADQIDSLPGVFKLQNNIVSYERFYMQNNSWRVQGAHVDFGLSFAKWIKEINVNAFITRLNPTDFSSVHDRLMRGLTLQIMQSKNLSLGYNSNTVFDVKGTVSSGRLFSNSVNTFDAKYFKKIGKNKLVVHGEIGNSQQKYTNDSLAPLLKDYFIHANAMLEIDQINLKVTAGYLNVGPDFRSIGSQSKDVNYNAAPVYYNRYTNAQLIRPNTLSDLIGNENIYNRTISSGMMATSAVFNNINPYGLATFNRQGLYLNANYKSKESLEIQAEYMGLSEIRGQGSFALRQFSQTKMYVGLPFHSLFGFKRKISLQLSSKMQNTKRNSEKSIENVSMKMMQTSVGLNFALSPGFEILVGLVHQTNNGSEFIADRNTYSEIVYFHQNVFNLQQQTRAIGLRYNFNPKVYICALYQQNLYQDKTKSIADFNTNQFGVIYSITL